MRKGNKERIYIVTKKIGLLEQSEKTQMSRNLAPHKNRKEIQRLFYFHVFFHTPACKPLFIIHKKIQKQIILVTFPFLHKIQLKNKKTSE